MTLSKADRKSARGGALLWVLAGAVVAGGTLWFVLSRRDAGPGGSQNAEGPETQEVRDRDGSVKERRSVRRRSDGTQVGDGLRTLYWPNGNRKMEMEYVDGKQVGRGTTWYEDGPIQSEGEYLDGKPHGRMITWHQNGKKASEGDYRNGLPNGRLVTWLEDGTKFEEGELRDGKRHGTTLLYDEHGDVTEVVYENGDVVRPKAGAR